MPKSKNTISLFTLSEVVLFPGMSLPLHIFEDRYKRMINNCLDNDKKFGVVFAKGNMCAEVGTLAEILDVEKLEGGKLNILAEGKDRFKILDFVSEEPYYEAVIESYVDKSSQITDPLKKSLQQVRELSLKALSVFDIVSEQDLSKKIKLPDEPDELLFLVSANLTCSYESKQSILETRSLKERTSKVLSLLKEEIERLEILLKNKETKTEVAKNGKLKI